MIKVPSCCCQHICTCGTSHDLISVYSITDLSARFWPSRSNQKSFCIYLTAILSNKKHRAHCCSKFVFFCFFCVITLRETYLEMHFIHFVLKWNFRSGEAQYAVDGCQMLQLCSEIYQLVSVFNFPLLSQNCFCWSFLCVFKAVFSPSSVHGVLSAISVTVTACVNLLYHLMIIRIHKCVTVLLRNNEIF